ncbi:MAG: NADH-quinone oxidoreductase subunit J [Kiritimatiellaeota bacterium]|nr:NADH-quinone oxidoreductase subunit J [Kiritimatiellota bacterium]
MIIDVFYPVLLFLLLLAGIWTVMTLNLLKSAIGLALTSAILALLLFRMDAPLAGVFELSVCAGLITVVFISAISLTKPLEGAEAQARDRSRIKRFIYLPIIVAIVGGILYALHPHLDLFLPPDSLETDVRQVLWNVRRLDLVGQILIILAGVFGVVILFKDRADTKGGTKS